MATTTSNNTGYIPTIGLEVHAQLSLQSKMFAPEAATYGALPNTLVTPISLAHPGTLPTINKKAIEYAIKFGLACHATINRKNYFARKNYFYPDLPKGYQISQDQGPICQGGYITITEPSGQEKQISLQRAHLEEDTGKSIHDLAPQLTLLDFNRVGVPLLEIVTQPVIQSSQEAYIFLTELRKLVRYLAICDGNMEEGSLRCDVNISMMPAGSTTWGKRVEIKNINSIKNVQLAIEYEIVRQTACLQQGETITSETRSYDALHGKTISQRTKETAIDYRYFIEPDLPPLTISDSWIKEITDILPLLPGAYHRKFTSTYNLSPYAASVITDNKETAHFFDTLCQLTPHPVAAANWLIGPIKAYLNDQGLTIDQFPLTLPTLSQLIQLVEEGKVSFSVASQQLFPHLLQQPHQDPAVLAQQLNILQDTNHNTLAALVDDILQQHPDKVSSYKKGKTGILDMLMGEIMKQSKGKAAPALVRNLLKEKMDGSSPS